MSKFYESFISTRSFQINLNRISPFMPVIWDIHDRIICGTALVYRDLLGEAVKILTKDEGIRDSGEEGSISSNKTGRRSDLIKE